MAPHATEHQSSVLETKAFAASDSESMSALLARLTAVEQRLSKDEQSPSVEPQTNGHVNKKSVDSDLQSRVAQMETSMQAVKDKMAKNQESVNKIIQQAIVHLTHVFEEREHRIKTEMVQMVEQATNAQLMDSLEGREKKIKSEMEEITDQVANATAAMIERILQDLASLKERTQKLEVAAPATNGRWTSEPDSLSRSCASMETSIKNSATPTLSHSVGQGSGRSLREKTGSAQRATSQHITENLTQQLNFLTNAVDRMVGHRACSPQRAADGEVRDCTPAARPVHRAPSSSPPQMPSTPNHPVNSPHQPLTSPQQTSPRSSLTVGKKPDSSPTRTHFTYAMSHAHARSPSPKENLRIHTPRGTSRDVDPLRAPTRGSHTMPGGSHTMPVKPFVMNSSTEVPVPRVLPNGKTGQRGAEASPWASVPVYQPKKPVAAI